MSKPLLSCLVMLAAACGGLDDVVGNEEAVGDEGDLRESEDHTPAASRCAELEGRRFETVDLRTECGPAPADAQTTCRWRVDFDDHTPTASSFVYVREDYGMSGTVVCDGASVIQVLDNGEPGLAGTYDANTERLEWDGLVFEAVP